MWLAPRKRGCGRKRAAGEEGGPGCPGARPRPPVCFPDSSALGPAAEAPGRRPCCPSRSHPHPEAQSRTPRPCLRREREGRGLDGAAASTAPKAWLLRDGSCGQRGGGAAWSPRHTRRALHQDPSPAPGASRHRHGASGRKRGSQPRPPRVQPSPQPETGGVTTPPQAGAGAPAPTPERSPCGKGAEAGRGMGTRSETPKPWKA